MTPQVREGQMWDAYAGSDLFCLTTNATVNRAGELVMGRGIALEAKRRFPRLPLFAGIILGQEGLMGRQYGLYPLPRPFAPLALFQVKWQWQDQADPALILHAAAQLTTWCQDFTREHGRDPVVHLAFPGIGNGGLSRARVWPLVQDLPACVTLWTLPTTPGTVPT